MRSLEDAQKPNSFNDIIAWNHLQSEEMPCKSQTSFLPSLLLLALQHNDHFQPFHPQPFPLQRRERGWGRVAEEASISFHSPSFPLSLHPFFALYFSVCLCVCVCVWVSERERERERNASCFLVRLCSSVSMHICGIVSTSLGSVSSTVQLSLRLAPPIGS